MQLLLIPYLFVIVQAISVFIYVQILNKLLKVPCKYGWQASWIIPFFITLIISSIGNDKTPTQDLPIFLNIILFFGLCPLLVISVIIAILSANSKNEAGGLRDGCYNENNK